MKSPKIIMNDDVAQAIAEVQDPEQNEGLRDGLDDLMTFVLQSADDAQEAIAYASTINLLQQHVRKLATKG